MRRVRLGLEVVAIVLWMQFSGIAVAQTRPSALMRIEEAIELVRSMPLSSREAHFAEEHLFTLVQSLAAKVADEKLIDELISLLDVDDTMLRATVAHCLQYLAREDVARKAIPKMLELLPVEECRDWPRPRSGIWASDLIKFALYELGAIDRSRAMSSVRCPLASPPPR